MSVNAQKSHLILCCGKVAKQEACDHELYQGQDSRGGPLTVPKGGRSWVRGRANILSDGTDRRAAAGGGVPPPRDLVNAA
jgi:hypothetical protein